MSNHLKELAFFADIPATELDAIFKLFHEETAIAGSKIFSEGDIGDSLYLMTDGAVRITTKIGDVEKILVTLRRGAVFGELATIEDDFRSATATAVTDSKMLVITRSDFNNILEQYPASGRKLLEFIVNTISQRLKNTTELYRQAIDWGLSISGILELNFNQLIANNVHIALELQNGSRQSGVLLKAEQGASGYELLLRKEDDQFVIIPYHAVNAVSFTYHTK